MGLLKGAIGFAFLRRLFAGGGRRRRRAGLLQRLLGGRRYARAGRW